MIDYDVETTGFQAYSGVHYAFSYQFLDDDGLGEFILYNPNEDTPENDEARDRIQWWFDRAAEDPDGIRAHNAKFDRAFGLAAGFNMPPDGKWHDSMLEAHAVNERRSVALKPVHEEMFGPDKGSDGMNSQEKVKAWLNTENARRAKVAKETGTEYEPANYSHVPTELMEVYGLDDVYKTRAVSSSLGMIFDNKPELRRVVEFERESLDSLFWIEARGLPARREEYQKLKQEVATNLELLHTRVMDLVFEADPVIFAQALSKNWNPRVSRNAWADDDPRLDEKDWFTKELKAGPVQRRVKHKGDFIDVDESGQVTSYYGKAWSLEDFQPGSSAHVLAALKARKADMRFMSEKNSTVSADADNLRAVDDALAAAILDFRAEAKVLSTYVEPMIQRKYDSSTNSFKEPFIGPDSRIHANYRQVGARTGRMSCSDPNMQNQPRDDLRLRYNIVADPGMKLVACDLSNIEMFLFTAYCGHGRLWDALENGDDLHQLTADMLGFRDRARQGGSYESARQQGKVYNFTTIYGGGLRSIRRYFRCSMDEARMYKSRFAKAFPEVSRLQQRIEVAVDARGYLQDNFISGRRFRVTSDEAYKGTNYLVQGTAAALLKYAVNQLHKDGVPMVALIHDEIVSHVPENEAQEVKDLMIKRMTYHPDLCSKFTIPLKAEGDIIDRWSDAKPLKEPETGRKFYFDPEWANVPRRYLDQ